MVRSSYQLKYLIWNIFVYLGSMKICNDADPLLRSTVPLRRQLHPRRSQRLLLWPQCAKDLMKFMLDIPCEKKLLKSPLKTTNCLAFSYCERFYYCVNGVGYEGTCQPNMWFDRTALECRPSDEVDCSLQTMPTTTEIITTTDNSPLALCRAAANNTYVMHSMACGEYFVKETSSFSLIL